MGEPKIVSWLRQQISNADKIAQDDNVGMADALTAQGGIDAFENVLLYLKEETEKAAKQARNAIKCLHCPHNTNQHNQHGCVMWECTCKYPNTLKYPDPY